MPEINLLPDELRDKEQKELRSASKKPKVIKIAMSSPAKDNIQQPLKTLRPSLLSRLFSKKLKGSKSMTKQEEAGAFRPEDIKPTAGTEKVMHIPKVPSGGSGMMKQTPDFLSPAKGNKIYSDDKAEVRDKTTDQEAEDHSAEVKFSPRVEKIEVDIRKPLADTERKNKVKKGVSFFKMFKKDKSDNADRKSKDKIFYSKKDRSKKDESVLDVNLIPAELSGHPELELPNKLFSSGLAIFFSILLVAVAYLGVVWYQLRIEQQIKDQKLKIIGITEQIASYENSKNSALALQQRLLTIQQLLDNHVYWTKFFEMLETYTINEVYFTNFSMAGTEGLVLSAVGRDYQSVAKQLVAFQQADDFIKDVRIDAASVTTTADEGTATIEYSGVTFSINLEFVDGVFLKN